MQLGKNECRLLKFLITYGNGVNCWHSIGGDSMPSARRLESKGFIIINEHKQARLNTNKE